MARDRSEWSAERAALALRRQLAFGDALALAVAWGVQPHSGAYGSVGTQLACAGGAVVVTMLAMQRAGLYRSRVCALRSLEAVRALGAAIAGGAAFAALHWLAGSTTLAWSFEGTAASCVLALVGRWRFSRWLKQRRANGRFLRRVVLVGTNDDAVALWAVFANEPELGYHIAAVAGPSRHDKPWNGVPRSNDLAGAVALARQTDASGLIIVGTALSNHTSTDVVRQALAARLHVQVWPGPAVPSSRRARMVPVSGIPLLYVEAPHLMRWQLAAKRTLDVVLAFLLIVLTAPLVGIAAVVVKLDDRGPVLHRSTRVGRFGNPIVVYKLRTMVPNAAQLQRQLAAINERKGGPLFKATRDPRVTRAGHFLRATSLDELPQLWNVLNGTMSLVGPRPALLSEAAQFDEEFGRRHSMRPGITGLWQIEARDNPSFSAYRRLDLAYIDDWSLALDVAILASTAYAVTMRALHLLRPTPRRRPAPAPSALPGRPDDPIRAVHRIAPVKAELSPQEPV